MPDDKPFDDQLKRIVKMVRRCEAYADEYFDGDTYFTSVTKFDDGDFRVAVRHGMCHKGTERDGAYRQDYEIVSYHHFDGAVVYARRTRYIDAMFTETHDRKVLA